MPTSGGTMTWAEQAASWPEFIFPFSPSQDFSIDNFSYFPPLG